MLGAEQARGAPTLTPTPHLALTLTPTLTLTLILTLILARAREEADGLKARLVSAEGAALAAVNDATQARAELQEELREARAVAKSVQRKSSSDLAAADAAAAALRRERDEALARAA